MIDVFIKQHVTILKLDCKINSEMQSYLGKTGKIKGFKKLREQTIVYLIEFLDYNRVWVTEQEFYPT